MRFCKTSWTVESSVIIRSGVLDLACVPGSPFLAGTVGLDLHGGARVSMSLLSRKHVFLCIASWQRNQCLSHVFFGRQKDKLVFSSSTHVDGSGNREHGKGHFSGAHKPNLFVAFRQPKHTSPRVARPSVVGGVGGFEGFLNWVTDCGGIFFASLGRALGGLPIGWVSFLVVR